MEGPFRVLATLECSYVCLYCAGPVARTILTKSGLDKMTLVKLWYVRTKP